VILLAALMVLAVLLVLFTLIQTYYLEGMRLRTRDLPGLEFFKDEFERRIGLRSDTGALTFSVWKHLCLILIGLLMLARDIEGTTLSVQAVLESAGVAFMMMLVCAYIVPEMIFRKSDGRWLTKLLPFYLLSAVVVKPVVLGLNFLHSLTDIASEEKDRNDPATPAENIEALIDAGTEEGLIEEDDRKLIQGVVAFGDKVVREVMTARPNIISIQADRTLDELRELVVHEQYSRIPVFETSIDDVIGFVHARDMFEVSESERETRKVRELMRPVRYVPETKPVQDLMREMQQEGAHMVIVVDEYGNTAGLATMEDLVEVIVGEIRDEHEPGSDVEPDGAGGFIVSGSFDVARVSDVLSFKPAEDIESTTIGGLVMEWMGRVPKAGESIERDGIKVEVLAGDEMRVEQVRLSQTGAAGKETAGPEAVEG
jgi:putative hemolysin